MVRSPLRSRPRRAASLVEFALVGSVALLFLFGIFEYARYIFFLQVSNNAAREGARFAVAHTGDGTTKQQVIDQVTAYMATRDSELTGYTVDVVQVDPNTGATLGGAWNNTAFSNAIEVRITGNYRPILPNFLGMSSTMSMKIYAMMGSEAN